MAETDCLHIISQAMGNQSIYEKLALLTQVWNAYFSEGADTATADGIIRVKKGFNLLYRETSNLVFLPDYKDLSTKAKLNLVQILTQCGVHLDGLGIQKAKLKCDSLAKTCQDPWGSDYFKSLSPEDAQNAIESFYISEFPEIARARIERLIANGDENNAFRLCNNYITSKEHVFQELKANSSTDGSLDDELIPIFVFFIQLLNKQNDLKAIVDRTMCLSCHQGCRLIRAYMAQKLGNSLKLALTLSEIFLLRDLINPNVFCCTKELMEIWSELQVSLKVEKKLVENNAWQIIVMYASTSAHFYLFVDVLWQKFGRKLTNLYIEFYIRGLTSDLNHLEVTRVSAPGSISKELETHIAAMYTKLSQLFVKEMDIARECLLSAFALRPTLERLNDLNNMCITLKVLNGVSPLQCENGDVIRPGDDSRGIAMVPPHSKTISLVSGPVLYEGASFKPALKSESSETVKETQLNLDAALQKELAKNGVVNPCVSIDSVHTSDSSRTEINGEITRKCNCEGRCETPDLEQQNPCRTYPFVHPILNSKSEDLPLGVLMDLTTIIETTRCVKWRNFLNWYCFPEMAEDYLNQFNHNETIRKPLDNNNDGDGSATEYEDQALPPQSSIKALPYVPKISTKKPVHPLNIISNSETDTDEDSDSFESSSSFEDFANSDETWESKRKKRIHKAKKKTANNPNERRKMIDHILRSSRKKKHRKVKGDKDRYFDRRNKKSHKKVLKKEMKDSSLSDETEANRVTDKKPESRPRQKSIDVNNPVEIDAIVGSNPRIMLSRLALEDRLKTPEKNPTVKAKPIPPTSPNVINGPSTSSMFKQDARSKLQVSLLAKQAYLKTGNETAPLIITSHSQTPTTIKNKSTVGKSVLKKKVDNLGTKILNSKKLPKIYKEEHLTKKKKKKKKWCSMQTQTDYSLLFSPMVPRPGSNYLAPPPPTVLVKYKTEQPELKLFSNSEPKLNAKKYFSAEGLPSFTLGGVGTFCTLTPPKQCSSNSFKELICTTSFSVKVMSDLYVPPPKPAETVKKSPRAIIQNKMLEKLPNIIKSAHRSVNKYDTLRTNQNNNNTTIVASGTSLEVPLNPNQMTSKSNVALSNSNVALSNSNVALSNSNVALSNSKVALSNSKVAASNSNVVASNSNVAVSNSNVAVSNSNVAVSNSNVAVSNSNVAVSNSNVAVSNSNIALSNSNAEVNSILTTSNTTKSKVLAFKTVMVNGKLVALPLGTTTRDQPIRLPVKNVVQTFNANFNIRSQQQCIVRQVVPNSMIIPQALPIGNMPVLVVPQKSDSGNKQPQNIVSLQHTVINTATTQLLTPVIKNKKLWTSIRKAPGSHEYRKVDSHNQDIDHGLIDCIRKMNAKQLNQPMGMRRHSVTSVTSRPETNINVSSSQQWNTPSNEPLVASSFYQSTENTPRIKTEDILDQAMDMAEVPKTIIDSKALEDMSFPIDYLQQLDDSDCAQADPESRAETATLYAATSNPSDSLLCQEELNILVDAASPTSGISGSFSPSSGGKVKKKRKKPEGDETPRKRKMDGSPASPSQICPICQKCMASAYNLRRHMKAIHNKEINSPTVDKELEKLGCMTSLQQALLADTNVELNVTISQTQPATTVCNLADPRESSFGEGLSARLLSPNQMETKSNFTPLTGQEDLLSLVTLGANLQPVIIKTENPLLDNLDLLKPPNITKPRKPSVTTTKARKPSVKKNQMDAISHFTPLTGQEELLGLATLGANIQPDVIKTDNSLPGNLNLLKPPTKTTPRKPSLTSTKPRKPSIKKKNQLEVIPNFTPLVGQEDLLGLATFGDNFQPFVIQTDNPLPSNSNLPNPPTMTKPRKPSVKRRKITPQTEKELPDLENIDRSTMIDQILQSQIGKKRVKNVQSPGEKKRSKLNAMIPGEKKPKKPKAPKTHSEKPFISTLSHDAILKNLHAKFIASEDSQVIAEVVNITVTEIINRVVDRSCIYSPPSSPQLTPPLTFKPAIVKVPLVTTSELEKAINPATTSCRKETSYEKSCKSIFQALKEAHFKSIAMVTEPSSELASAKTIDVENLVGRPVMQSQRGLIDSKDDWVRNMNQQLDSMVADHNLSNIEMVNPSSTDPFNIDNLFKDDLLEGDLEMDLDKAIHDNNFPEKDLDQFQSIFDPVKSVDLIERQELEQSLEAMMNSISNEVDRDLGELGNLPVESGSIDFDPSQIIDSVIEEDMIQLISEGSETKIDVKSKMETDVAFSNTIEPVMMEITEPMKYPLSSTQSTVSVPEPFKVVLKPTEAFDPIEEFTKASEPIKFSENVSEPMVTLPNVREPVVTLANVSEPVVFLANVPEPVVTLANVPEPVVTLANVPEPVVTLANVPEPVVTLANVPEPVVTLANVPEPVVTLANVPEPVLTLENVSEPMVIFANSANSPEHLANISGPIKAPGLVEDLAKNVFEPEKGVANVSESEKGVANVSESEKGVANVSESEKGVANVSEPKEVVANVSEPKEVVANVSEPKEVVANVSEPKEVVANVSEPKEVVANVSKPKEVVANVSKPKEVVANVSKPEEVVANVSEPEEGVANVSEPEEGVANVSEPEEGVANVSEPEEGVANVSEPEEGVANVSEPEEGVANVSEPEEGVANVSEPEEGVANVSKPEEGVANVSKPEEGVANVSKPEEGVANVSEPEEGVANVSEPEEGVANVSEPEEGGANVSKPEEGVANVSVPEEGVANVSEPEEGVENVSEPEEGVENVSEPEEGVANVSVPLEKVANVSAPVEGVTNLPTPVEGVTNLPTPVVGVTNLPTPVEGVTNLPTPVEGVTNLPAPVEDVANVSAPVEGVANVSSPVEDVANFCKRIKSSTNIFEHLKHTATAFEPIEAPLARTELAKTSNTFMKAVEEAETALQALPCSTTVIEPIQYPTSVTKQIEDLVPETTEAHVAVSKNKNEAIMEANKGLLTDRLQTAEVTENKISMTAKHIAESTTSDNFKLSLKPDVLSIEGNVARVSSVRGDFTAKQLETKSSMQLTKEVNLVPKKMTPREKQGRLKKPRDIVYDTCKVVINRIINIVVDQESKSNVVKVASWEINRNLIETKIVSTSLFTKIDSQAVPKESADVVIASSKGQLNETKPILINSTESPAQASSTIKTSTPVQDFVLLLKPKVKLNVSEKPMTFQEQYEMQIKTQMMRQAELEKIEALKTNRAKKSRKPSNPTRLTPSKIRTLISDPEENSKEVNFVVQGMVDRVSTSSQRKTVAILEKSKLRSEARTKQTNVSSKKFKISETLRDIKIPLKDCARKTENISDRNKCSNPESSPEIEVIAVKTKNKLSENIKCVLINSTLPRTLSLDSSKQTVRANSCENKLSKQSSNNHNSIELRSTSAERMSKRNNNTRSKTEGGIDKTQIKEDEDVPLVIINDTPKKTIRHIWEKTENSESSSEVDLLMEVDCCDNNDIISDECKTPEECLSECEYLGTTKNNSSEPDMRQENEGFHQHPESNFASVGRRRKREAKSHPKNKCTCCEPEPDKRFKKSRKGSSTSRGNSPSPQITKRGRKNKTALKKTLPKQKYNKNASNNKITKIKDEGFRILRSRTRSMT